MGGLGMQLILTIIVLLALALGGKAAGQGERAAMRVRALAGSALVLTVAGYAVLFLAGRLKDGGFASGLSFLALSGGVVLGALVAVMACAAGLTYAARERHWRWLGVLLVGALVPLLLGVVLVSVSRAALAQDPLATQGEAALLLVALALAALAPLAPLVYGAWAAYHEADPSPAALAMLDL
jgi:hypothetical protein